MGAWGSVAPIAARGEEEEDEAEAGGVGWVKLMVRSTGDGMEWAVDLAVSKLEEGGGVGESDGKGGGGAEGGGRGGQG